VVKFRLKTPEWRFRAAPADVERRILATFAADGGRGGWSRGRDGIWGGDGAGLAPAIFRHHALGNGNLCYATAKFQPATDGFCARMGVFPMAGVEIRKRAEIVARLRR